MYPQANIAQPKGVLKRVHRSVRCATQREDHLLFLAITYFKAPRGGLLTAP